MDGIKYDDKTGAAQEKATDVSSDGIYRNDTHEMIGDVADVGQLQRHLGNRQVQLIAIGGSIGTATFVSIANGLVKGGPGSLLIACKFDSARHPSKSINMLISTTQIRSTAACLA